MRKGCVSQDRETTWFSVIYSLRLYPYMETTGFMSIYYKNFVAKKTTDFLVLSTRIFWKGIHLVSGFVTHVNHWVSVDIIFLLTQRGRPLGFRLYHRHIN